MSNFSNLHIHSEGSFLDGLSRVGDIAKRTAELGQPAVALTDHGECNQHLAFQNACKENGVKSILGMESYFTLDLQASRDAKTRGYDNSHITLLAKNDKGLENLWAWSSLAYEPDNFYNKPQADLALMKKYSEGLYASDGCFAGSERYLTVQGVKIFTDTVGTIQKVLGKDANWVDAEIRSFGVQQLYRLVLRRYGVEKEILTTANHRWLTSGYRFPSGPLRKNHPQDEKLTANLSVGETLRTTFSRKYTDRVVLSPTAIQAGIVFGDGTTDTNSFGRRSARVKLYGTKDAQLLKWFPLHTSTQCRTEDAIEVRGLPGYFKDAPSLTDSTLSYLYWWLSGYFAADGCVSEGGVARLSSSRRESLSFVQDICQLLGIRTGSICEQVATKIVPQGKIYKDVSHFYITLNVRDVQESFFLINEHGYRAAQVAAKPEKTWSDWTVLSVGPTERTEEVFCAVVPDGHAFTLADNILTGNCLMTEFSRRIDDDDEAQAREILGKLLGVFGDSFYMELHPWQFMEPSTEEQHRLNAWMTKLNQAKVRFANELSVPMVVVNDAHYAWPKDWENHGLVWDFNTRTNTDQRSDRGQTAAWMMGDEELCHWMAKHGVSRSITEEAIKNSFTIAENCNVEIKPTLKMPRLNKTERGDMLAFLELVEVGWQKKVVDAGLDQEVYHKRAEEEIEVIVANDFAGYFNIVADYVTAAKSGSWRQYVSKGAQKEPLLVGPGRGSAGGSLVAYLLDITTLDPIKYGLLFGRFINPGRKGFPDIDVDVPQSKRAVVKDYIGARFGHDHVCGIGTRTRSRPKAMLADLCRVMPNVAFGDRKKMSEILEEVEDITDEEGGWDQILAEKGGDLAQWAKSYPKLFQKMGEMLGLARQSGTHASGILVTNKPILGTLPTRIKNEQRVSQFDMHEVEWLGAIKLDLLGLRHLDTLMVARQLIYERHGRWLDYEHFEDKEFLDPEIWPQMDKGNTAGIFQLETVSGTKVTVAFQPRSEIDVAALISVNRPGVIRAGLLQHYLRRRHGTEAVKYDHPLLENIVGETYGILVYQEQLIQAVQDLAGFTMSEADDLRSLVGKKKIEELGPMKAKFIAGCQQNYEFALSCGDPINQTMNRAKELQVAEKIWKSFEASGSYCFNKSHAMGYATISSWEIWTKHYYPQEFIVALMQTDSDNINRYVREARKHNYDIYPPDVNQSEKKFTFAPGGIRFGIDTVRGVGPAAAADIMRNRPFKSLEDFTSRTDGRGAGKKSVIDNLIKIGAFDTLGDRTEQLETFYASRKDCSHLSVPDFSSEKVVYEIEKELVGNYVTVDPMGKYLNALEAQAIKHPEEIKGFPLNESFVIGGMITKYRKHKTKRGKEMAFLGVSWQEEDFDITIFPEAWQQCKNMIKVGAPVSCRVIKLEQGCCLTTMDRLDSTQ